MPRLNLTMEVDGNKIYADGDLQVPECAGTSFSVIGKIAPVDLLISGNRPPRSALCGH
jgi:hypothetical protein